MNFIITRTFRDKLNNLYLYFKTGNMLSIKKDTNLKSYNTFGLDVKAKELAICPDLKSVIEIIDNLNTNPRPFLVLGGGSNLLFSKDFEGLLIHPTIEGIEKVDEDSKHVWIEAGAGVEWDNLVDFCVKNNWYGLENLSYIPGNVGASPVQNIGAYGVEVKDSIESVKGIYINNCQPFVMKNKDCQFDYRYSIFKDELKHKTIIVSVVFKLKKQAELNLSYGPVKEQLSKQKEVNLQTLRNTIIDIRKSKLPEPSELGNAGSFFKNPIITKERYENLLIQYSDMPHYKINESSFKIPAGWLIDKAGWKGKSIGGASVHEKQALVLINKNNASSDDIIDLAQSIIHDIKTKFEIKLEPEVNII